MAAAQLALKSVMLFVLFALYVGVDRALRSLLTVGSAPSGPPSAARPEGSPVRSG